MNHDAVENVPYNEEVDFPEEFKRVEKELLSLYRRKNHDYGNSFHDTWLEEGAAMARIRLSDKLARFKKLSRGEQSKVTDESIRDTLIDLAAYSIMTIVEMDLEKRLREKEDDLLKKVMDSFDCVGGKNGNEGCSE